MQNKQGTSEREKGKKKGVSGSGQNFRNREQQVPPGIARRVRPGSILKPSTCRTRKAKWGGTAGLGGEGNKQRTEGRSVNSGKMFCP